ncbi:MAG: TolC family protein [Planctomycetes bacterium]|nr:TolC family protein [Planctomycetota bacterium]
MLLATALVPTVVRANPPQLSFEALPEPTHRVWTLDAALAWALQNNPELAVLRQQHGIAEAAVVIARTYPFNPASENRIQEASGPASAGITNVIPLENLLLLEVEIRHQGRYRRQAALAGLSRTDWDIAFQEQSLAVRVMRAFGELLYRRQKLELLEETIRLNEQLVRDVQRLLAAGRLAGPDLIVAQTEVDATRALLGTARGLLSQSQYSLARELGLVEGVLEIQGSLEVPAPTGDAEVLTQVALERRADLRSTQAAVAEAEANLRLEVANRFGNPVIGPAFTYDPTRVSSAGVQINFPLPVLNTHRGEIMQRRVQQGQAELDVRRAEIQVRQDVQTALSRLRATTAVVETYRDKILPNLRQSLNQIQQLFRAGQPGVDLLRVVDVQRKLLQARDNYLDALFELNQARADLAAAIGEPIVTAGPGATPETASEPLPPQP